MQKNLPLAPIAVEILISQGLAYKIEADSGTVPTKIPDLSASKNNTKTPAYSKPLLKS